MQLVLKRERIEKRLVKKDGSPGAKRVFYKCATCGQEFPLKEIQLDHVIPVGHTPGSKLAAPTVTWDSFIARMFCSPDNLVTVCKPCHGIKTKREAQERWAAVKGLDNVS